MPLLPSSRALINRWGGSLLFSSGVLWLIGGQPVGDVVWSVDGLTWQVAPEELQSSAASGRQLAATVVRGSVKERHHFPRWVRVCVCVLVS